MSDYDRARVGDLVVLGGTRLGSIVQVNVRQGGASGVRVLDGGQYSRFVQDWCVHLAVLGRNVCPCPLDVGHACGLLHVTMDEVGWLRRSAQGVRA